jgi:hypothetical protein
MKKMAERSAAQPSGALRETFLFVFTPEEARVLRWFVDVIEGGLTSRSARSLRSPLPDAADDDDADADDTPELPYTVAEMAAVAADLSFLETFLLRVAAERSSSGLDVAERSLADFAERLAPQVGNLAEALEEELARFHGDGEEGFSAGDLKPTH